ncbi:MAG: organic solvent tolerance protein OstA [Rhodothermales bacterium]|nr:organic solvent tolerance protein OstA [Rhodothermales bacterium]
MKRLILLLALVTGSTLQSEAQQRRFNLDAGTFQMRVENGVQIIEMTQVFLRQETITLRAARGVDYGNGTYLFSRNVRIIDQGDTLTADEVRYNRITKVGRAVGRVRLGDGEVVVTAPEGDFDLDADRADFRAGVQMVDSVSVLTSRQGSYWTEEKRAEFFGSVRLDSDDSDVLADSLTYWREGQRSDARGNVVIVQEDEDVRSYILAQTAVNDDSLGTGVARGNVLVVRISVDSTASDTLYLAAERLESASEDGGDQTFAVGNVRVADPEFSAIADSVAQYAWEGARNESRLFGNPFIWVGESQVAGDTIRVTGHDGSVDSLVVRGNAFVAQRDTLIDRLQQMKGRGLLGLFEQDSLRVLEVRPNAEAVYFNRDEADSLAGALQVTADRIRFLLQNGEISDLRVYQDVNGTYFPGTLIPADLRLDGLLWKPESRPDTSELRRRLDEALVRLAGSQESDR